jgi:predicted phage terminase large subunit-like protein
MGHAIELEEVDWLAIEKEACGRSLATFAQEAWHVLEPATPMKWGWALDAICEHLEAVSHGEILRLLMNVPPGTMKSLLTGVVWPAWEWGPLGKPHLRYVGTAHKEPLAVRDSLKCRRLVQSAWYQRRWPLRLTGDQNAKTKFENAHTGFREAMAFGSMTGSRGDRVILDDPHSVDDANSETKLAADIVTFREALPSRVNNDESAIVIVMQRLNEADVSGTAIELGYEHLMIPMRYEPDRKCRTRIGWEDPRTKDGELMFPERFSEKSVKDLEQTLGEYAASGQLQQRPVPRGGGILKTNWWKPWPKKRPLPPALHVFSSVDTAYSEKDQKHAAFSAVTVWMIFEDETTGKHALMLLGAWWDRVGYPELKKHIASMHKLHDLDYTVIERKASGISLIQDLRRQKKPRLNVRGFDPGRMDKVARAYIASPMLEQGRVYYPEGREWATKVINFVGVFPAGAAPSADITDTVTQAVLYTKRRMWAQPADEDVHAPPPVDHSEDWLEDNADKGKRRAAYG